MKVLPFTIPSLHNTSFLIERKELDSFYPYLHRHKEIQICWILKGRGTLIAQADLYPFKENDIFLLASNCAHLFKNKNTDSVSSINLFFEIDPGKNTLMALPEMRNLVSHFKQLSPVQVIPSSFAERLLHIKSGSPEKSLIQFISLLHELAGQTLVQKSTSSAYSELSGDRLKVVMDYTLSNFHKNIDIKKIAKLIHYTPEAFCRFFKKRTEKTFIQYLSDLRISEACNMITSVENQTISSIAYACGFNNVSHFNRVFKKAKGQSPLVYRKQFLSKI